MSAKMQACGLCGKTKDLTKTPCCDNWICNDMQEYKVFSYDTNSCSRNHDRYTLCSYHYHEEHPGKWQDCDECKDFFDLPNYADMGTNEFNFEKLANPPEFTIECSYCGYKANSFENFALQTSQGWCCVKNECQNAAVRAMR